MFREGEMDWEDTEEYKQTYEYHLKKLGESWENLKTEILKLFRRVR